MRNDSLLSLLLQESFTSGGANDLKSFTRGCINLHNQRTTYRTHIFQYLLEILISFKVNTIFMEERNHQCTISLVGLVVRYDETPVASSPGT